MPFDAHEITKVYDTVPRTDDVFNLNRRDVVLTRELGGGNFGSVMLGEYRHRNKTIPVAIKMLKQADVSTAEVRSRVSPNAKNEHFYAHKYCPKRETFVIQDVARYKLWGGFGFQAFPLI